MFAFAASEQVVAETPALHQGETTDFGEIVYRHEARQGELLLPAVASPAAALALLPPVAQLTDTQSSASGLLPEKHSEEEMEELQFSLRPWINSSCLLLQHTMKSFERFDFLM